VNAPSRAGVPLSEVLALAQPQPNARFVVFHCADPMVAEGSRYYESIDLQDAHHPQTILAYAHIAGGNGGYWEDQGYEWYAGI
jgi:DMSO/TMAO reductase YedYZ molybdopterin-dependent catalytic subunit